MALLVFSHYLPPRIGGIRRYAYELACAFQRRGEEVVLFGTDGPDAEEADALSPVTTVRVGEGSRTQVAWALAQEAAKFLKQSGQTGRFRATVAASYRPAGQVARLLQRRYGIPYVMMVHDRELETCPGNLNGIIRLLRCRQMREVVPASRGKLQETERS